MLKTYIIRFLIEKFFSSSNDFKEFENYRIGINTSRTNICITLLFPLMLFYVVLAFYFIIDLKAITYIKTIFFLHIFYV